MKTPLYSMFRRMVIDEYTRSNMSQVEFCKRVRISRNAFQKIIYEDNRTISTATVESVMQVLNYTYTELERIYGEPQEKNEE